MSDSFATPWTVVYQAPLSMRFPSKHTGVDCYFLLQGTFSCIAGGFFTDWGTGGLKWERHACNFVLLRVCVLSHFWLIVTAWTVAHQGPLSMGFPRQKYCSGLPFPSPGDLLAPGSNLSLLHWQADSLPVPPVKPTFPVLYCIQHSKQWHSVMMKGIQTWVWILPPILTAQYQHCRI